MPGGGEQTHFGYQSVPLEDKQGRVDDVFHSVARRYDLMNDLMSGGLHRAWKDALLTAVNPPKSERNFHVLDLAGGTGDVAFRIVGAGGHGTRVTVCDINAGMLEVGRERATARGFDGLVAFEQGNAEQLPYADRSFDCVTVAFGIRNVPRIDKALDEAHRLVKERDGEAGSSEGIELCARIEGVRLEIEAMRLRRSSGGGGHFDPEWINDIPWKRSA